MASTQIKQKEISKKTTTEKDSGFFKGLFKPKTFHSFLSSTTKEEDSLKRNVLGFIKEYNKTFESLSKK